jgi:hypothetical protein
MKGREEREREDKRREEDGAFLEGALEQAQILGTNAPKGEMPPREHRRKRE